MHKKPEVTEATKARLKDAFWELYSKKGIEHISVKEITDLAGYNRGTFYLYYKDVYDMLAQIEDTLMKDLTDIIYYNVNTPPEELKNKDIHKLFSIIIELYERNKKYLIVLFSNHGDPKFRSAFKQNLIGFFKSCSDKYKLPSSIYLDYFLEYYVSGVLSMITKWFENRNDIPVEEILLLLMVISARIGFVSSVSSNHMEELKSHLPEEYLFILEQLPF